MGRLTLYVTRLICPAPGVVGAALLAADVLLVACGLVPFTLPCTAAGDVGELTNDEPELELDDSGRWADRVAAPVEAERGGYDGAPPVGVTEPGRGCDMAGEELYA